jgi:hypothetical protein
LQVGYRIIDPRMAVCNFKVCIAQYCLPLSTRASLFLLLNVEPDSSSSSIGATTLGGFWPALSDYETHKIICHMKTLQKALTVLFSPNG